LLDMLIIRENTECLVRFSFVFSADRHIKIQLCSTLNQKEKKLIPKPA
jgi:hypothetical protein